MIKHEERFVVLYPNKQFKTISREKELVNSIQELGLLHKGRSRSDPKFPELKAEVDQNNQRL